MNGIVASTIRPSVGVEVDHDRPGEEDREGRLDHEDQAVAEEEAHDLEVDGRARHQLTGLLIVEEADLEVLKVASRSCVRRSCSTPSETLPLRMRRADRGAGAKQPDADHGERDQHEPLRSRQSSAAADRGTSQQRDRSTDTHRKRRQNHRPGNSGAVRLQKAKKSPEIGHFRKYSFEAELRSCRRAEVSVALTNRPYRDSGSSADEHCAGYTRIAISAAQREASRSDSGGGTRTPDTRIMIPLL